jgi:hypothetical protein
MNKGGVPTAIALVTFSLIKGSYLMYLEKLGLWSQPWMAIGSPDCGSS